METKFYFDTEGNDDSAYKTALQFACELSINDPELDQIILLIHTKRNTGWFQRLFGDKVVKEMFSGYQFNDCPAVVKFETKITYRQLQYGNRSHVVICCGLDSEDILKIDDYDSVKYIIAIPWLKKLTEKWIKTWNAKEISGKEQPESSYPDPSPIVKCALTELSDEINMSTGIHHPMDNERAKTYIRSLHKYESELNPDSVRSYLVKDLHWDTQDAEDIVKLIETLNDGKYFQGGEKKGLQVYYKRWKKETKN